MNTLELVLAGAVGVVAGSVFFGGLWWTVRRLPTARHPALLALASMLVRTTLVCALFVWVAVPSWQRFVACLIGFVVARIVCVRRIGPRCAKEVRDAAHS